YASAQKFDYDASLSIDPTDGYVDLADFTRQLSREVGLANLDAPQKKLIQDSAGAVFNAVIGVGQAPAVIAIKKKPSATFRGANGLSIYLPLGEQDCRPTGLPGVGGQGALKCPITTTLPTPDGLVLERQLGYYADPNQLAFSREDSPARWADLLERLELYTP